MFRPSIPHTNNTNRAVPYAWIFDVDGVLTHPSEKKVTEPEIFRLLMARLLAKEPVIFNTGRAVDFVVAKILEPLEQHLPDRTCLANLFAVGEKGAVCILYDDRGNRTEYVEPDLSVDTHLHAAADTLVQEHFADVAFFDHTKKTMISVEMHDGLDVAQFQQRQTYLNRELASLLANHHLTDSYVIDASRIATDVQHRHVGKALGIERALGWMNERKIAPRKWIAFGDSLSDIDMAIDLHRRQIPFTFVFVGEKALFGEREFPFPIVFTTKLCEQGTREYLEHVH